MEYALRTFGISKKYKRHFAVNGATMNISEGDIYGFVGENGSGKSTLTKALLGLISPVCGCVEYGDGLKSKEIGYLPQQTDVQKDFPASVYEIVISGCHNNLGKLPFYKSCHRERAMSAMKRLGIDSIKNTFGKDIIKPAVILDESKMPKDGPKESVLPGNRRK